MNSTTFMQKPPSLVGIASFCVAILPFLIALVTVILTDFGPAGPNRWAQNESFLSASVAILFEVGVAWLLMIVFLLLCALSLALGLISIVQFKRQRAFGAIGLGLTIGSLIIALVIRNTDNSLIRVIRVAPETKAHP